MRSRTTIDDVARAAGVTKGTVSRVLAGTYRVSPKTAAAVRQAVDELGYVASVRARALATGRADAIAVVLSEPFDYLFEDPTFAKIMKGISDAMSGTELVPVLLQTATAAEQGKALRLITNQAVDAVIHLSPWHDEGLLETLASGSVPVVLCGQVTRPEYRDAFSIVYADDVLGAERAARHLEGRGVTRPVAILGAGDQPASHDRMDGYRRVFPGLTDDRTRWGGWSEQDGVAAMHSLLADGIEFDGVLAASDRIARGALTVLAGAGRRVPQEVRVIGFDDHETATSFEPQLTTIAQPMHLQGVRAVEIALEMIAGAAPLTDVLPTTLRERATA